MLKVASLRQALWRVQGAVADDPMVYDDKPTFNQCTDMVMWIDTDVMIADPLTKQMDPEKLIHTLNTGRWDPAQPIESLAKKRAKQSKRSSANKHNEKEQRIMNEDNLRSSAGIKSKYDINMWQQLDSREQCEQPQMLFA